MDSLVAFEDKHGSSKIQSGDLRLSVLLPHSAEYS